jgi:membrane protease YdiL (CAAX protease family)
MTHPAGVPWRRILLFFTIAMLVTHLGMALYLHRGGATNTPGASAFGAVFMRWCPGLVALLFQRFAVRRPLRTGLDLYFRPNRWFVASWLTPAAWILLALGVTLLLPGTRFTPDLAGMAEHFPGMTSADLGAMRAQVAAVPLPPLGALLAVGLLLGPTLSTVAAFGEEVAWRGLLLRELAPLGFLRSALLAGAFQAAWHVPFVFEGFFLPGHPWAGTTYIFASCLLTSIVMSYLRLRAKSVIAAAIFHGTAGACGPVITAMFAGGHPLLVGIDALAGVVALLPFVAAVLFMLKNRPASPDRSAANAGAPPG